MGTAGAFKTVKERTRGYNPRQELLPSPIEYLHSSSIPTFANNSPYSTRPVPDAVLTIPALETLTDKNSKASVTIPKRLFYLATRSTYRLLTVFSFMYSFFIFVFVYTQEIHYSQRFLLDQVSTGTICDPIGIFIT